VQPALCVFVGGGVYKYWKERPDFEKLIVQKLAEYFKEPKMLHPTEVKWNPWEDQTSMGGPVGNFPPGVLSQIDDLRMPEGRIHWAGTEMATESVGFMDGAI
jgi:monoamine oxidase